MRVKDTATFILKARSVHGNAYSYTSTLYQSSRERVRITCESHGEFEQVAADHVRGVGCPACAGNVRLDLNSFVAKARAVHGDRYGYDQVVYTSSKNPVTIACSSHGAFEQTPDSHLSGKGCRACAGTLKKTTEQFIRDAHAVHGERYVYDRAAYLGAATKLTITCREHGDFEQTPNNHLSGFGCAVCAGCAPKDHSTFEQQARALHKNKYVYSDTYVRAKSKITIVCPTHGPFQQRPADHLHLEQGCPDCWSSRSSYEIELEEFLTAQDIRFRPTDRRTIAPLELDLVLPDHNLAIEVNGLRFHTDRLKEKNYHYEKWKACARVGLRLLHVNEDEWLERPECIKNKILNLCGRSTKGVGARKLSVRPIAVSAAKDFTQRHHIQGRVQGITDAFGAFEGDRLVAVMTFSRQRGTGKIELSRFCTDGKIYSGAFSKMFKTAVREKAYTHVLSFADRRYSDGGLYEKAGFKHTGNTPVDYRYVRGKKTFAKRSFTKDNIKKRFGMEGRTEREMMDALGYERIYDCGKMRFEWVDSNMQQHPANTYRLSKLRSYK